MKSTTKGFISVDQNKIEGSLDITIVYCPPLEVYGYGVDENEAHESFKISLAEFFRYCTNKNTLRSDLERLGWQMKRSKSKPMIPPSITELLSSNENLSRIYNNFDFRKTATVVSIPKVA